MIRKTTFDIKNKRLNFDLQSSTLTKSADGKCVIEGYANTSAKDRVGDVVMPSAFEKSLETYMKNPVLLANHDWKEPCGVVSDAKVVENGLWIKATISETRDDIKTLIREGCLRTFSIGYNEITADYDEATKTKYIKELELLEISVVTVPANAEAMFTQVTAKAETESAEKADDSAKSAPEARTAKELKDFIDSVKSVLDRDLDSTELVAVSDYVINAKDELMNKEQLIAALTAKSLDAATAAPAPEAKADAPAPDAAKPADGGDMMKEILAKLDAIGQAMAQVLEGLQADASEDQAEDAQAEQPVKEEAKADAPKEEEKASDDEDLDEKDIEKELAEIDSQISAIEDQHNL